MPALWCVPEELEDASSSAYAYEACKTASFVLWSFSGRKYHGTRTVTERYECACRSAAISPRLGVYPYMNGDGQIYNALYQNESVGGCGCSGTVGGRHVRLRLRGTPVRSVHQVKRGDEVIPPDQYKIVNSSLLQLTGTSLDVCGIEITYTYGVNIPMAGRHAARKLATELIAGWTGSDECVLPDRVTNVSRQGISFTVIDPQDFLDEGRTGIYEVDLFLRAANPDKARKPARVFSPDLPKAYRVTVGTAPIIGPYDWKITPSEASTWTVDLAAVGGDILLDPDWNPTGQITSWNGATLLEFDSSRFTIVDGVLTVSLTGIETAALTGTTAAWDLYAISATDGYTLIHVLGSKIWLEG